MIKSSNALILLLFSVIFSNISLFVGLVLSCSLIQVISVDKIAIFSIMSLKPSGSEIFRIFAFISSSLFKIAIVFSDKDFFNSLKLSLVSSENKSSFPCKSVIELLIVFKLSKISLRKAYFVLSSPSIFSRIVFNNSS